MWDKFTEEHFRSWAKLFLDREERKVMEERVRKYTETNKDALETMSWGEMVSEVSKLCIVDGRGGEEDG